MGELADAIGLTEHDTGRALFQGTGTVVTTQLITNVYGMATGAYVPNTTDLYTIGTGFNAGQIIVNIGNVVGSYVGGQLGAKVVSARFQEGALGGAIGRVIGSGPARRGRPQSKRVFCNRCRPRRGATKAKIGQRSATLADVRRCKQEMKNNYRL